MIRTIIWLLYAVFICITLLPYELYWKLKGGKEPGDRYPGPQRVVNFWVPSVYKLGGMRLHKKGEENIIEDRPALYVGNHQGDFDIFLIAQELGSLKSIVAKKESKKVPVIRTWMKYADCIFIDRGNPRQTLQSINQAQELLERGRSVVIFPEGTRSRGPEMNEFKAGAFRCALKAGVPIVPFAIDGTYKIFEQQNYLKPADVQLSILPAVETKGMEKEKTRTISAEIQQMIQDELYSLRGGCPEGERKVWTDRQN